VYREAPLTHESSSRSIQVGLRDFPSQAYFGELSHVYGDFRCNLVVLAEMPLLLLVLAFGLTRSFLPIHELFRPTIVPPDIVYGLVSLVSLP